MEHRENLLETVIFGLLRQLQHSINEGVNSEDLLKVTTWTDTCNYSHSVKIELDWATQKASIKATSFPILVDDNGEIYNDPTGTEELFLDLSMEKDEDE